MTDLFEPTTALPELDNVAYCDNRLDRFSELRDETSLEDMMRQSGARYFLLYQDKVLMEKRPNRYNALYCQSRAEELGADRANAILLGTDPGERNAPRLAMPLKDDAIAAIEQDPDYELWTVRAVGIKALIAPDELGALAQAKSLISWHENHQFCAKCGAKTHIALAGARRDCPTCKAMHFPRTDPVVIMLAIHKAEDGKERCLLAHHTRFDGPMYSTLAGFVEQGETLEAAVRREISEEAGIPIGKVRYAASQPWPFPSSLMLACFAQALDDQLSLDETELTDAKWLTREEATEMLARPVGDPLPHVPAGFSIAAWLIRSWLQSKE